MIANFLQKYNFRLKIPLFSVAYLEQLLNNC